MDFSLEKIDKVSAVLTIKLEKADYADKVEKAMRDFRKRTNMPGFRPGQVPMGLLKKRFGKGVMAEEINKLVGEKLYGYIRENNLNILGEPLPDEDRRQEIDFDTMEEFSFAFDLAFVPEFKVEADGGDTIDYYDIRVDDAMVDDEVKAYARRAGGYVHADSYEPRDMVKGSLAELDGEGNPKEGGVQVEEATLLPEYMNDDGQKDLFRGCKAGDVLVFNPKKAYEGKDFEISSLLNIKREDVPAMTSDFSLQVKEVTRFKEAELNQELFDQVFGTGKVTSEEEFRDKIREGLKAQLADDSDRKFISGARAYFLNKVGKLEYPEAFLKRFMRLKDEGKEGNSAEENYDKNIENLTWHLIKEQLVKAFGIKVGKEDLTATARKITKAQFARYGIIELPESVIDEQADKMLQRKDNIDMLTDSTVENKLAAALKNAVKLNRKEVSMEEFNKLPA